MVLNAQASYPHDKTFVLKLHHSASPRDGRIVGRLEHVPSGHQFLFDSASDLVECLVKGVACAGGEGIEGTR